MISLKNISKFYKSDKAMALEDISLSIERGEMIALCGRSGAGKSTLINCLGFLDEFTEGEYYYQDMKIEPKDYKKQLNLRKSKIGFVVQNFALIPDNTVFFNIALPLMYQGYSSTEIKKKVQEVSEVFEIDHLLKRLPQHISGGESQRVAIARALINQPDIILADEPTASLDEENEKIIIDIFKELNRKGITIILVTHDEKLASQCKRVIRLAKGRIISDEVLV